VFQHPGRKDAKINSLIRKRYKLLQFGSPAADSLFFQFDSANDSTFLQFLPDLSINQFQLTAH